MVNKYKRGNAVIYHGQNAWVEIHSKPNEVVIYFDIERQNVEQSKTVSPSDLKPVKKVYSSIQNKPKSLTNSEKAFKAELNVFYAKETLTAPYLCDNCQKPLMAFTKFEIRCCIAHILEKSKFKSVAIHPQNKLFLCAKGGCHAKFDQSTALERSKMNVYSLAIERFEKFKEFLTDSEYVRALTYLNIEFK